MSYFSCCNSIYLPSLQSLEATGGLRLEATCCCKRELLHWKDHRLFKGILLLLCPPQGHAASTASSQSRRLGCSHCMMWLRPSAPGCEVQECPALPPVGKMLELGMMTADWHGTDWTAQRYQGCVVLQSVWWRYLCFVSVRAVWLHFCLVWSLLDHGKCTAFFHFLALRCFPCPSLSPADFPC